MRRRRIWSIVALGALLFLILPTMAQEDNVVTGTVIVDEPGFDEFEFVGSYVYVFETNEYVEVSPDGSFTVAGLPTGLVSFKSYVPGFEPTYRTVQLPEQDELTIPVQLQVLELEPVVVERTIPAYLEGVRELTDSPEIREELPSVEPVPVPEPDGESAPEGINLRPVLDSIRNLFRRNDDREE